MAITVKPSELAKELVRTILGGLPVLIKGAPGIGKSDIVGQAAVKADADLILTHPVVSDPTDAKGLPAIVDGKAEFLPYGDLRKMMQVKRRTVIFIDDLGQAPAVVQAAYMQLLLAREINGKKISDHVVFVAATNRREDRAGVTGILEPVKSRFASIVELEVNLDDWCAWAYDHEVPAEVIAFIRFRPNLLMDDERPTADIVNRPSPRTVAHFGKLLKNGATSMAFLAGAAGEGFAAEFIAFQRTYQSLPSIEEILKHPDKAKVPKEPAALYAVAVALAIRATDKTAGNIMKYAARLPAEFSVLTVRDCVRKCSAVANCPEFIAWATKHQEVLT